MFTSSYPLRKTGEMYDRFFTPKISFRYSPNKTRNIKDDDVRIDMSNINSFNRIGKNDAIEGGQSITLNTEYKLTNKQHSELFSLGLATVFRDEEDGQRSQIEETHPFFPPPAPVHSGLGQVLTCPNLPHSPFS